MYYDFISMHLVQFWIAQFLPVDIVILFCTEFKLGQEKQYMCFR